MRKKIETRKKLGRICALVVVGMFVVMTPMSVSANDPFDWTTQGNIGTGQEILGTLNYVDLRIFTGGTQKVVVTTDGSVGIGTRFLPFPESYLHVEPERGTLGKTIFQAISPYDILYQGNDVAVIRSGAPDYIGTVLRVESVMGDSEDYALLNVQNNALGIQSSKLYVRGDGQVGIGTTSPGATLEVAGAIKSSVPIPGTILFYNTNEAGNPIGQGDGFRIRYEGDFFGTQRDALIIEKTDGNNADPDDGLSGIAFTNRGNDGAVETAMVIKGDGKVGIGMTSPAEKLDVNGTVQMIGFKMPTGASSGRVLTSDANGVGTWQEPQVGIGGSGTTNYIPKFTDSTTLGNSVIYESGGNIGIGTTSPTSKLDVDGNDIRIRQSQTPSSSSADGYTGEIAWDQNAIYVCTNGDGPGGGTDTWKRASISIW